jgi:hypothetical protein
MYVGRCISDMENHGSLHRLYRLDVRRAVLDRTAHDLCSSAFGCAPEGGGQLEITVGLALAWLCAVACRHLLLFVASKGQEKSNVVDAVVTWPT